MKSVLSCIRDGIRSLVIMCLAFVLSLLLQRFSPSQSLVAMLFVLAVFLISVATEGYVWGMAASLVCVLVDNYVFAFPYFRFNFTLTENFISAIVLLVVSFITCTLTTKIKEQEKQRAEGEKEKMRANLLRAISHDLRTPLTTIYGSCSAIMENYDSLKKEQQLELLEGMREDSENLIRMVENLLSVTRVNEADVKVGKKPTVLEELIDTVLMKFHKTYPEQEILVEIPEEFISIPMDALLIEQVLVNLLENAMVHAKGMTMLSLRVTTEGNRAVFTVADDGCGIPKERMEGLFTGALLGQGDSQADSGRSGMGIGLSVCRTIVKAHGGEITAENQETGGAVFSFWLEMEVPANEQ